jgi:ABC-type branched-subunit amino acid transport system ATPase component
VHIGYAARTAIIEWAEKRQGPAPEKRLHAIPKREAEEREPLPAGTPALRATDIVVRFGGIAAVDRASIEIGDGEVVGLIGTNGAGKSTLMNAIGGFVPCEGQVEILGEKANRGPAARARQGLGRSFQAATLFPELTVRETVLVAFEARKRTGFLSSALFLPPSIKLERSRKAESEELIDFLGLGRYADTYISDLSTGTRRIVELAGLLALDTRVLCLDEPTAGVAQRETEAFGPLILELRRELGASMLVIEHDMPLIMSISDRVYCLELGHVIAEGDPSTVRNDPSVIASYLGTDERAIARSGAVSDAESETTSA